MNVGVSAGRHDQVVSVTGIDAVVSEVKEHVVAETRPVEDLPRMGIGNVSTAWYRSHISLSVVSV
jgi:hypothetical protein